MSFQCQQHNGAETNVLATSRIARAWVFPRDLRGDRDGNLLDHLADLVDHTCFVLKKLRTRISIRT
jgi:hypothetical protein